MKPAFRIILALSSCLAACGHSKPELFLDQTTTALECSAANARDCTAPADAGSPRPELDECYGDGDCEYGEVCERRHGVSLCQPADGHHSDDDGYAGHGGDDGYGSSAGSGGSGGDDRPDGGSAGCDAAYTSDDHPKGRDDCRDDDDDDHDDDGDRYEDRSGSNSGRH